MHDSLWHDALWQDTSRLPESLALTTDRAVGFTDVAHLLSRPSVRRIVVTGNGASFYVGLSLWLAALSGDRLPVEVVAVPGGLVARGLFRWRPGDILLAVSSSGEFRDVIEAVEDTHLPRPFVAVTATPDSTIGRAADAYAVVSCLQQEAITHTQAYCGAVVALLDIWSRVSRDATLEAAVRNAPEASAAAIAETLDWGANHFDQIATPTAMVVAGSGPAWAAALESALLVKEVARIPCEGAETREAATSAMTGMSQGNLGLSLPVAPDTLLAEAEEIWRSAGARVVRAPGGGGADPRLAAVTTFPASVALAAEFAHRAGLDVDSPAWYSQYLRTARSEAPQRAAEPS